MGLMSNVYVVNTLVSMYGKCGSVTDAENVFVVGMPGFDPVSWNAMLSVYVERGEEKKSLLLYRQMQEEEVSPDVRTFVIVLQACISNSNKKAEHFDKDMAFDVGQALHSEARRRGFCSHGLLVTALISMYGKCERAVEAENVLSTIRNQDVIMWNSMLTSYADSGDSAKALQAYVEMQRQGIPPDQHTFVISLQASCKLGGEQKCKSVLPDLGETLFLDADRHGFAGNSFIGNTLISLYSICGDAMKAEEIFGAMHDRKDVSWNALMSTYVERGEGAKAL
jgi:pentatricopeptide repeat protein